MWFLSILFSVLTPLSYAAFRCSVCRLSPVSTFLLPTRRTSAARRVPCPCPRRTSLLPCLPHARTAFMSVVQCVLDVVVHDTLDVITVASCSTSPLVSIGPSMGVLSGQPVGMFSAAGVFRCPPRVRSSWSSPIRTCKGPDHLPST